MILSVETLNHFSSSESHAGGVWKQVCAKNTNRLKFGPGFRASENPILIRKCNRILHSPNKLGLHWVECVI